jgi:hypothetical protein
MRTSPAPFRAFSAALLLATAGCSANTLGTLGDILGTPGGASQTGQLSAEIRQVDTQNQRLEVVTQDGQSGHITFDQSTIVVYQQQQYPVTALERGDVVTLQVQQDSRGTLYTNRIDVQQSVQDRSVGSSGVRQFYGRVGAIDRNRGMFVLQTQSGNVTVTMPYNTARTTRDYFSRLRTGDTVRVDATLVGNNRAELYRFR